MADTRDVTQTPPTIYDVARVAGVSIASVSRVLNGRRNPREETKERVLQAVAELGFVPDGAARALSGRLKEVVGVVIRRVRWITTSDGGFAEEDESLQFTDVMNRGIELAAQRRGFNLLVSSVDAEDHDVSGRLLALARKSDGLILHDRVLEPDQLDQLSRRVPIVTLANVATKTTTNVHSDNTSGMQDLAVHLLADHGYRSIGYLAGLADSPDSLARRRDARGGGRRGRRAADDRPAVARQLLRDRRRAGDRAAAGRGGDAAAGYRLRQRPDRARRHVRAGPARHRRARGCRGDRLRRHPDGTAPAAAAHHRAPADPGDRRHAPSTCCTR